MFSTIMAAEDTSDVAFQERFASTFSPGKPETKSEKHVIASPMRRFGHVGNPLWRERKAHGKHGRKKGTRAHAHTGAVCVRMCVPFFVYVFRAPVVPIASLSLSHLYATKLVLLRSAWLWRKIHSSIPKRSNHRLDQKGVLSEDCVCFVSDSTNRESGEQRWSLASPNRDPWYVLCLCMDVRCCLSAYMPQNDKPLFSTGQQPKVYNEKLFGFIWKPRGWIKDAWATAPT